MKKNEIIDLVLRVVGWGLVVYAVAILILRWLGVVGSPGIIEGWLAGLSAIVIEMIRRFTRLETKFDMLWGEFKKRKKI